MTNEDCEMRIAGQLIAPSFWPGLVWSGLLWFPLIPTLNLCFAVGSTRV